MTTSQTSDIKYARPDYDIAAIDPHWADVQMVRLIGTGRDVLELGCASGHFGKYLQDRARCRVWAIELDPRLAAMARPYYQEIFVGSLEDDHFFEAVRSHRYDVILCSNVLEHTTRPRAILERLKPLLQPGGFFVVALPNVAYFKIRLRLLFGDFDPDLGILAEDHCRFFTLKTARTLLEGAGLKIESWSFDSDNGIPKLDGLLRRLPGGARLLQAFYSLCPTLFGFQFIFKAVPAPSPR